MAQTTKVIDITKTYVPTDPNAFPENLGFNNREDYPNNANPILPYEGWNILPTSYGYKSFFGTNGKLGIDALPSRCDYILLYQKKTLENFLIALTEEGIYTKTTDTAGAWTHDVVITAPPTGTHYEWSWCVIGEVFYAYLQGGSSLYVISPYITYWIPADPVLDLAAVVDTVDNTATIPAGTYSYYVAYKETTTNHISVQGEGVTVTIPTLGDSVDLSWNPPAGNVASYIIYRVDSNGAVVYRDTGNTNLTFTDTGAGWTAGVMPLAGAIEYAAYAIQTRIPNTLNMAGQLGIFKAGVRLGFWDSENSIGHSGVDDKLDFVTSLKTLANTGQKFDNVTGKIVKCLQHGDGFIIYSTRSIVLVQRTTSGAFMWDSKVITGNAGIAYPKEVTMGQVDTIHYAWTSMGLLKIENGTFEVLVPQITDFLAENKNPIYLDLLQNRYLCLSMIDPAYIYGKVSFTEVTVPPTSYTFQYAYENWINNPGTCTAFAQLMNIAQIYSYAQNINNWDSLSKAAGVGYPINTDVPVYVFNARTSSYTVAGESLIPDISALVYRDLGLKTEYIIVDELGGFTTANWGQRLDSLPGVHTITYNGHIDLMSACIDTINYWEAELHYLRYALQNQTFAPAGDTIYGLFPWTFRAPNIHVEPDLLSGWMTSSIKQVAVAYTFSGDTKYRIAVFDIPECSTNWGLSWSGTDPGGMMASFLSGVNTYVINHTIDMFYRAAEFHTPLFYQYDLLGNPTLSATPGNAAPDLTLLCPLNSDPTSVVLNGVSMTPYLGTGVVCSLDSAVSSGFEIFTTAGSIIIPASSYLLQNGSAAPIYPIFEGALVYDMHLKKWGKFKGQYQTFLDYAPINNISTGIVPYEIFGIEAACLLSTGFIVAFDDAPSDSYLKYGKIGYTRGGMTEADEIVARFRQKSTGTLGLAVSIDGTNEDPDLLTTTVFTNVKDTVHYPDGVNGKWFAITLTGIFDLDYLEFTGHKTSRR